MTATTSSCHRCLAAFMSTAASAHTATAAQGVIAITPQKARAPFKIEVPVEASNGPVLPLLTMSAQADLRVHRQQIPLVSLKANTLHAMQGTTADPGMIFHWVFPRRTTQSSKWLAMYAALSLPEP